MTSVNARQLFMRHRAQLSLRWLGRFYENHAGTARRQLNIPPDLTPALTEEVLLLLWSTGGSVIPRRHRAATLADLAEFPESVSVCVDLMQAGLQVLGAFVVENSGPAAAWSVRVRNQLLGELDAIFHILVHREIQALCDFCLGPGSPEAAHSSGAGPTSLSSPDNFSVGSFHRN